MTTEQFTYWLHGFFEIADTNKLTPKQVQIIKDHLDLVFDKQTPNRSEEITNPIAKDLIKKIEMPYDSKAWDLGSDDSITRPLCNVSPIDIEDALNGSRPRTICSISGPGKSTVYC